MSAKPDGWDQIARVADHYEYWGDRPPEPSAKLRAWLVRIVADEWRPNRRWEREGYDNRCWFFGVWMWEYLHVLYPLVSKNGVSYDGDADEVNDWLDKHGLYDNLIRDTKPCGQCGLGYAYGRVPDPCLGRLPYVRAAACCGHGNPEQTPYFIYSRDVPLAEQIADFELRLHAVGIERDGRAWWRAAGAVYLTTDASTWGWGDVERLDL